MRTSPKATLEDETRTRIMVAALRCIDRWGVQKTGLGDIAKEAGCARQTVYNHFPNAEAVILAALLAASSAFTERLYAVVRAHDTPAARILGAMMFCLAELPKEPFLKLVSVPEFAPLANDALFRAAPTWAILRGIARACLAPDERLTRHADELAEMMTRLLLSMLTLDAPIARSERQTRAVLERWLLPPLGLSAATEDRRGARRSRPRRGGAAPR